MALIIHKLAKKIMKKSWVTEPEELQSAAQRRRYSKAIAREEGQEPELILAARHKNHQEIERLVGSGTDLEVRDTQAQRTALSEAVASGSLASVMVLLSHGADIHAVDRDGYTALHWAAKCSRNWLLETLLKRGAKIDCKDKQDRTALHISAILGNASLVGELLAHGSVADERDMLWRTPLHYAAQLDLDDVAKRLLASGADINAIDDDGNTALHLAASRLPPGSSVKVVKLLLDKKARPSICNKQDRTPAFNALAHCCVGGHYHTEVLCVLLQAGGQISGVWDEDEEFYDEEKMLTKVASWGKLTADNGYEQVMKLLIARCKKLDNKDKEGKTALHWAVLCDCVGVVQRLLEKGASVKVEDEKGRTPLHVAVTGKILDDTKKKEAIVKILLKHGADSDAKDAEGKTPLQKMPWWRSGYRIRRVLVKHSVRSR